MPRRNAAPETAVLKPESAALQGQGHGAGHGTVVKRVKGKGHDEGHGGAWKVAFADFCLALLCLFLVLWLMAARDKEQASEALRAAGGGMMDEGSGRQPVTLGGPRGSLIERHPVPLQGDTLQQQKNHVNGADAGAPRLSRQQLESSADMAELAQVLGQIGEQSGLANNLHTVLTPQGLRVLLHDTEREGMFERGGATPSPRFHALLRKLGPLFAQIENQLLVVGHTDATPYSSSSPFTNWNLSGDRAMAARAQLLLGGMPTRSVLQVVGMADRAPLDTTDPRASVNRRIELMVLTPAQAQNVIAMFGATRDLAPLIEGAATSGPLQELRARLQPARPAEGGR